MDGCETTTMEVAANIDRVGGWILAGYGATALVGAWAESSKKETEIATQRLAEAVVCVPAAVIGLDPEVCPRKDVKKDENVWIPLLAVGIPALVDIASGSLNSRAPNPLYMELECSEGAVDVPAVDPL